MTEPKRCPICRKGHLVAECSNPLCGHRQTVLASGDSGRPREAAREAAELLEQAATGAAPWPAYQNLYEQRAKALRAELGRAGTEPDSTRHYRLRRQVEAATWEQAAKVCEEYAVSAHPMAKLELKDIATALRARADAEESKGGA